jgi:hypothetical protein
MPKKVFTPEQIVAELREIELALAHSAKRLAALAIRRRLAALKAIDKSALRQLEALRPRKRFRTLPQLGRTLPFYRP